MAQRKISAYWLILIAVVLILTLSLSVGISYARFVTTDQWDMLVTAPAPTDRMLVLDAADIIDLGRLGLGTTSVSFTLSAGTEETLLCGAADGITAVLQEDAGIYTLTLQADAYPEISSEILIPVFAGEKTLGTFRISLPGIGSDPDSPEVPSDENTQETPLENTAYFRATPQLLTNSCLEIDLGLSAETDRVELTLGEGFPAMARYSLDEGSSWYLLYYGGTISLQAQAEMAILVDLPDAAQPPMGSFVLKAECYSSQNLLETFSADVEYQTVALTSDALLTGGEDALTLEIPQCVRDMNLKSTIEILTTDGAGNLTYVGAGTAFEVTVDDTNRFLTVRFAEQLPQAGTYRLKLAWTDEETQAHQSLIPFFISYSDANTGGAE